MKKIAPRFGFVVLLLFMCSCGGVIGNIERYQFNSVSPDSLKKAVMWVRKKHPELNDFDTSTYHDGQSRLMDGEFYCRIRESNKDILLVFAYPIEGKDSSSQMVLTSGGTYKAGLPLARDISPSNKAYFKHLFKKYFISELERHLQVEVSYPDDEYKPIWRRNH
jgi:hypothetical protein